MNRLQPLLLGLTLLALPARAEKPSPQFNEVSVGATVMAYSSFFRILNPYVALEASYRRTLGEEGLGNHIQLGGGLRVGHKVIRPRLSAVTVPGEVFLQARLRVPIGPWEPSVGPEIGLSGLSMLYPRVIPAEGDDEYEQSLVSPLYLVMSAAPLRFRFGRLHFSVLEFHLGTSSIPFSNALRFQVSLLDGGFSW